MIRLKEIAVLIILCCSIWSSIPRVRAEEPKEPEYQTQLKNWKLAGILSGSLNVTQFEDWQAGGSDTVALISRGEIWALRSTDSHEWKTRLQAEYGTSKTDRQDYRTASDLLKLDSRYDYKLNARWSLYGRGYLDTHMVQQYSYFDSPTDIVIDDRLAYTGVDRFRIADSFDPILLEEGLGLGLIVFRNEDQTDKVSMMTGPAARQTRAADFFRNIDIEETPEVEFESTGNDSEFGWEFVLDALLTFNAHVKFTSFATGFIGFDDELWRARWDNTLEIKLGKFIGVGLTANLLYDESVFDGTQYKTGTLITLSYRVF